MFLEINLIQEMGVPEGRVIEERKGGVGVLAEMLESAGRYRLTGYLGIRLAWERGTSKGLVAFNSGQPVLAVYEYTTDSARELYEGPMAMEFIWEDSVLPDCLVSVHGGVSPRSLEELFPSADITRASLIPPDLLPRPGELPDRLDGEGEVVDTLRGWHEQGYDIGPLLPIIRRGEEEASKALPYFRANLDALERLKQRLRGLDSSGHLREVESIRRRMVHLDRVVEIEREIDELERRVTGADRASIAERQIREEMRRKKVDEHADSVYDLVLRYHRMRTGVKEERCVDCGSPLDEAGRCPRCSPKEAGAGFGRRLNPRYTFASFVSGPNSRFAEAAARAVARNPGRTYNPLFIYSKSGLGKTHLLQAVGNHILEGWPDKRVIYSPIEVFESELVESIGSGQMEDLRRAYQSADVLLLDDVQFLAGKERAQEEMFAIFNEMVADERQIVLACDRPPKEIPSLSERLMTRFECGLIADIQPPDLETRRAILEAMVEMKGVSVPDEVLVHIAEVCRDNVRQLEGGLNRVVAFSSLMRMAIDIDLAREVLQPRRALGGDRATVPVLKGGMSYLVEEERPALAHRLLVSKAKEGMPALAITRGHPRHLREVCGDAKVEILWLTDLPSERERTVAPSLERIMLIIEEFVDSSGGVVLLDDVQYLISNNTFEGIVRFVRTTVDKISETDTLFLLSVNPTSLDAQKLSILEREMVTIQG